MQELWKKFGAMCGLKEEKSKCGTCTDKQTERLESQDASRGLVLREFKPPERVLKLL